MDALEIVVIVVAVLIVAAVAGAAIWRKVKGKPSLGSDCCGCPYAKDCKHAGNCASHTDDLTKESQKG